MSFDPRSSILDPRTFAVIPAAGQSTRMGRPKLALPLGGRSVLERVLAAVRQGRLDAALVRRLLEARANAADRSLVIPTFGGRRGHPAVIDWKHVAGIRALPQGEGLNRYFRQHAGETLEVPVASADVLCDLDTPEE